MSEGRGTAVAQHQQQEPDQPEKLSWFARMRQRHRWLDHLVRAAVRYQERYGDQLAAAVTYFTVLSLVPLLMIVFAVAGFVLAGNPELLANLKTNIAAFIPNDELRGQLTGAVEAAVGQRFLVGLIGLAAALYSGLGWMSNLRDALTAQWGQEREELPFLRTMLVDLLALFGLLLALAVSFGITGFAAGSAQTLLGWVGLSRESWAGPVLGIVSVLVSLASSWLVFLWALTRLPRKRVGWRSAMRGAVLAAIGFEILKQVGSVYLKLISSSPSTVAFGSLIGVLLFFNLVWRFLLFVTAWTATSRENLQPAEVPVPGPAIIRPVVQVRNDPSPRTALGLLGVGAFLGLLFGRLRRR